MGRYITVFASFVVMLCIGSVYAWSIFAAELTRDYAFSASQAQLIFGLLIAIFPVTMIFVGQLGKRIKARYIGHIAGLLFAGGYLIAGASGGSFPIVLAGIGVLGGIATGFGYWMALTTSVQCFPEKKGLITGIAAAGFGLGAVFMSEVAEQLLSTGRNVLDLMTIVGVGYGLIIVVLSTFVVQPASDQTGKKTTDVKPAAFLKSPVFQKLFIGIFLGTFAGLLVIGSLKLIGGQADVTTGHLLLGVSVFAVANFAGRLTWGFLSDYTGASMGIFLALLFQAGAILAFDLVPLTGAVYLVLSFLVGFGFGGNFVLFAKETAQEFGVGNLGIVYPYIFVGYAIAGIAGPFSGGLLFDLTGSYSSAIILASVMSLAGSLLFLLHYLRLRNSAV
ncbi:MAG: MFS transporter, OFA family, oxalate/formate antiporter [Bacteroidetes bacterium HLUCCA01]|nr:MAG: MFS transporter, OFA family, oxalate/formate antiporter [Bacteroidetes bacterium HLUCCA01]